MWTYHSGGGVNNQLSILNESYENSMAKINFETIMFQKSCFLEI